MEILASAKTDREMGALAIFLRFAKDVLLTGAVYIVLTLLQNSNMLGISHMALLYRLLAHCPTISLLLPKLLTPLCMLLLRRVGGAGRGLLA
jgi:hypothetical protein